MTLRTSPKVLLSVIGIAVSLVFLSPYLVMLFTSLKPFGELALSPARLLPINWDPSSYITMWSAAPVGQYLVNSLIVASASTAIVLAIAIPAAYATARFAFRGRRVYLFGMLIVQMLAPVALIVGIYREFSALGLLDSLIGLIIINSAFNLAFAVWLMRAFITTIPVELEEAAWLDGCSRFTALTRVLFPVIRPGVVTVGIYSFIASWNEFIVALTLITTEANKPLQVGLTQFIGRDSVQWQHLFATSLIAIVPVAILFLLVEKHLVGGLTSGSVK